jgi:hypothetical protein
MKEQNTRPSPLFVQQSGDFADFWTTLPRAIVMSTGEFEYSSISEELTKAGTIYATSTVLIFLVFLFLIFLVLMNVMTGLAVTDAKVRTAQQRKYK